MIAGIGADFNMEASLIQSWAAAVGGAVVSPSSPTCAQRTPGTTAFDVGDFAAHPESLPVLLAGMNDFISYHGGVSPAATAGACAC